MSPNVIMLSNLNVSSNHNNEEPSSRDTRREVLYQNNSKYDYIMCSNTRQ